MKLPHRLPVYALAGVACLWLASHLTAADNTRPGCSQGSGCVAATAAAAAAEPADGAKPKPYPLDTCIVSGEKLGEMGKPFVFVYRDQEIKLCCKSCKKDFDKDPEKFLKKLADAKK